MPGFRLIVLAIIFTNICQAQVYTVDTLMRNGNRVNRINIAYISDGYQAGELPQYITNATSINTALFNTPPFSDYKSFFNSFAIRVPSVNSGALHPATATDESSSGGQPVANPNNAFRSTFDYASIHRLLVPQSTTAIYNTLAANLADYDQAFIVVNSTYYGGSGGAFATSSIHFQAAEIAIHEIGHSFAGLADEYWAGDVYAYEHANMTRTNDPATVKWKSWLGIRNIGIFPYGTTGNEAIWFRPHQSCKMQFLGVPFCAVCSEALISRIHVLTNMIDSYSPGATSFTLSDRNPVNFSVTNLNNNSSTISVRWFLNGNATPFATGTSIATIPYANFIAGTNTVRAEVIDNTTLSKSYLPAAGYVETLTWSVNNPAALPVTLKDFRGGVSGTTATLQWEIEDVESASGFEVEKSTDGSRFTKLATVLPQQLQKRYETNDLTMASPFSYYRLRINEKSGNSFYSNIIRLQAPFDKFSYKVYQQPEQRQYRLVTALTTPQKVSYRLTDAKGAMIAQKNFGTVSTPIDHRIDISNRAPGIYYLSIFIGDSNFTVNLLAK